METSAVALRRFTSRSSFQKKAQEPAQVGGWSNDLRGVERLNQCNCGETLKLGGFVVGDPYG